MQGGRNKAHSVVFDMRANETERVCNSFFRNLSSILFFFPPFLSTFQGDGAGSDAESMQTRGV